MNALAQWLSDYRKLLQEIDYLEFNLERNQKELKRWVSGDLKGVKLEADSFGSRIEENIKRIKEELAYKQHQAVEFYQMLGTFEGLENKILFMRYIECKSFSEIAEELNYSVGYIRTKHAEIKRCIEYSGKSIS